MLNKDRPTSLRDSTRMARLPSGSLAPNVLARKSSSVSFFLGSQQRVEEEAKVESDVSQLSNEAISECSREEGRIELTIAPWDLVTSRDSSMTVRS